MVQTTGNIEISALDEEIWSVGDEEDDAGPSSWQERLWTRDPGSSAAWQRIEQYWERKRLRQQLDDYELSVFLLDDDD